MNNVCAHLTLLLYTLLTLPCFTLPSQPVAHSTAHSHSTCMLCVPDLPLTPLHHTALSYSAFYSSFVQIAPGNSLYTTSWLCLAFMSHHVKHGCLALKWVGARVTTNWYSTQRRTTATAHTLPDKCPRPTTLHCPISWMILFKL